jgi:hypothetical protein
MVEEPYSSFCHGILSLDGAIRAACLTNEMGRTQAIAYRQGLSPILSSMEIERYVVAAIIGTQSRQMFEPKTGKLHYIIAVYDKIVSITIPIACSKEYKFFLLASFDVGADYQSIVEGKIIPYVMKNIAYF